MVYITLNEKRVSNESVVIAWLEAAGLNTKWSPYITQAGFVIVIAALSTFANFVVKRNILSLVKKIVD